MEVGMEEAELEDLLEEGLKPPYGGLLYIDALALELLDLVYRGAVNPFKGENLFVTDVKPSVLP